MKILLVNNYFHIVGGAETYFFNLAKLLEREGHEVIFFSMKHPKNFQSDFSKYFVSYFPPLNELSFPKKLRSLFRVFYSFEARKKIHQLIKDHQPDVVHIHNIWYEITHSIIQEIKNNNIPVIMTLHDYRLICPNHHLLVKKNLCFRCRNGRYYNAILKKCLVGSFSRSLIGALINYFNNLIIRTYKQIDLFVSPSNFLLDKLKENKAMSNIKIVHLSYCIDLDEYQPIYKNNENSIVYIGRLSDEKGLEVLLDAVKDIDITLKIIGTGSLKDYLFKKTQRENISNVKFIGFLSRDEIKKEVSKSLFSVLPSLWYENYPYSIIESFSLGKPVIASKIGGIPELVINNETGLTFERNNHQELKEKIQFLLSNRHLIYAMGKNARLWVEQNLSFPEHYRALEHIYKQLI